MVVYLITRINGVIKQKAVWIKQNNKKGTIKWKNTLEEEGRVNGFINMKIFGYQYF